MERAGTVLAGRYRLVRPVGQGGLASVWEAEHVTLGSRLAIKFMLRTGPSKSPASQRFLREARIAASVKHRNVLEITDFGFSEAGPNEPEQGEPYMVMELLHGRTLGALLEAEKRLDVTRAVDIVSDLLRGLAAVHEAQLVHRDIKPDNIFLVEDEDGAFPKLVDFGLSRRTGRGDITTEGMLLGTPLYMAPEQAIGSTDLDARVDIYSMGVVLYELIAGKPPFPGTKVAEVLHHVLHDAPTPLGELVRDVPPAVLEVVETAMQKERTKRYPDARAMRTALLDAVSAASGEMSLPAPVPLDVHGRTVPAMQAIAIPVPALRTSDPPDDDRESESPPPAERPWLVAIRTFVLGALVIGVALLVLDGPWSTPAAHDETSAPVTTTFAEQVADASVSPLLVVVEDAAAEDAGAMDAGPIAEDTWAIAAETGDAALALDSALVDADDSAIALDADPDAGLDDVDAGEDDDVEKPTRRTRRTRVTHPVHRTRRTTHVRRRRTTRHRIRRPW